MAAKLSNSRPALPNLSPGRRNALRALASAFMGFEPRRVLPAERTLAAEAGASRAVIRGLLHELEAAGFVWKEGRQWRLKKRFEGRAFAGELAVSRREEVKNFLVSRLGAGGFRPGERVVELSVARELGVATISVREALLEMAPLGVFVRGADRGWRVAAFTEEGIRELWEFREMVEIFCLRRLFARGLSAAEREELTLIRKATAGLIAARRPAPSDLLETDLRFHRFLLARADNRLLAERADFVYLLVGFQLMSPHFSAARGQYGLRQHLRVQDAILRARQADAEKHLLAHLRAARETISFISRAASASGKEAFLESPA